MKASATAPRGSWLGFAVAATLGLVLAIGIATASQYFMPSRVLRPEERLSHSVGLSDAICKAQLLYVSDSSRPVGDRSWTHDVELVLRPIAWIVGRDIGDSIRVGIDDTDAERFRQFVSAQDSGAVAVFFLVRVPHDPRSAQMAALIRPPNQDWVLLEDPYGIRAGMIPSSAGSDSAVSQVREEVARHSLSALAESSDVIVLGRPVGVMGGRGSYTLTVQVDSLIAGSLGARTITLQAPTPSDLPNHPSLMFLRHAQGDTCTVVTPAANQTVRDGLLTKSGISIGSAIGEIRTARGKPARKLH